MRETKRKTASRHPRHCGARNGTPCERWEMLVAPGEPALTHPCTDKLAPCEQVAREPPCSQAEGINGRDERGFEAAFPQGIGPGVRPVGMARMAIEDGNAQCRKNSLEGTTMGA